MHLLCQIADETFHKNPELKFWHPECPAAAGKSITSLIKFVQDRPGHDRRYAIDSKKIAHELGYAARLSLEEGLRSTFTWYLQNEYWWRNVMDGNYQQWVQTHYDADRGVLLNGVTTPAVQRDIFAE